MAAYLDADEVSAPSDRDRDFWARLERVIVSGVSSRTLKALNWLDAWCPGANASNTPALLTVGGAVAAVAAVAIGGPCVPPIMAGMQTAMSLLTSAIDDADRRLAVGLRKYTAIIHANWKDIVFRIPDAFTRTADADSSVLQQQDGVYAR